MAVVLLAVPTILGVILGEVALRFYGFGHPAIYTTNLTYRYSLAPNQNVRRFGNSRIIVDSMGLRSVKDWSTSADRKILFHGDSVTYGGSYVDTADLFSQRTCDHLSLQGTSLCGNAGVNAYGTDNMAARLTYGPIQDESVDIVTLIAADTLRGLTMVQSLPYFTKPPPPPFRAFMEAGTFAIDQIRAKIRFGKEPVEYPTSRDHEHDVAVESLERLYEAVRLKERQGKTVLVVMSPRRPSVEGGYQPLEEFVFGHIRSSGVEYLEMAPLLAGKDLDEIYYDNVHLDTPGHDLYGRILADYLSSRTR